MIIVVDLGTSLVLLAEYRISCSPGTDLCRNLQFWRPNGWLGLKESNQQVIFRSCWESSRLKKSVYKKTEKYQATTGAKNIVKSKMGRKQKSEFKYKPEKVSPGDALPVVVSKITRRDSSYNRCGRQSHTYDKCNFPTPQRRDELMTDSIWLGDNQF